MLEQIWNDFSLQSFSENLCPIADQHIRTVDTQGLQGKSNARCLALRSKKIQAQTSGIIFGPRMRYSHCHPFTLRCDNVIHLSMVLLTMTSATVAAIQACQKLGQSVDWLNATSEPSLVDPAVGKPVSHAQLLAISKFLREHLEQGSSISYHLDELLRGSRIYYEPPRPKAEPVLGTTHVC